MYSTCLFCHSNLGANDAIEPLPLGRRLAFDGARGRLWVVCGRCHRWNLTPLEERWEAIEECERRFRDTRLRVSTGNVGLARLADGTELVRIGAPLRPEFAAWRYGERFRLRYWRAALLGADEMVPTAAAVAGIACAMVGGLPLFAGYLGVAVSVAAYRQDHRVALRIPTGEAGAALRLTRRHLQSVRLAPGADGAVSWTLQVAHKRGVAALTGEAAGRAAGLLLARLNGAGGRKAEVESAVRRIEGAGDAARFVESCATTLSRPAGDRDGLPLALLPRVDLLALEMAVHEESERHALEGELAALARAWREAEEIARIADDLL